MVPILKMRRFPCLLRLSLPPEMGEIAQTFIKKSSYIQNFIIITESLLRQIAAIM